MVKKGYYGNEGLGLARDHIEVCQVAAFTIINADLKNSENLLENTCAEISFK